MCIYIKRERHIYRYRYIRSVFGSMGLDHPDRFFARKSRRTTDSHDDQLNPIYSTCSKNSCRWCPSTALLQKILLKKFQYVLDFISSTTWFRRRDLKPDQGPNLIQPPTAGRKRKGETWLSLAH